ncbi:Uncharacterized protein BM_BM8886 [Brugia malayi]|uniref:Bm8886 n=1 Tax=Brugia malayi TaxID=6279 RepID=A0A0K0JXD3_BRUMA|nr:Uncharacterized protein BM_BM8886 [Brugia malayi]CDP92181.1 Bm8886 [Brugia malayi]VIO94766.1 Uncharacterized protein BM_BM8886 [Brugia malayi]
MEVGRRCYEWKVQKVDDGEYIGSNEYEKGCVNRKRP